MIVLPEASSPSLDENLKLLSKDPRPHPSWIEIDLAQFRQNIRIVKKYLGKTSLCLPVKADAYGHGLIHIAKVAEEEKVDYLAVAHLEEGAILRENGIKLPILVLGAIHEDQIPLLLHYELEITISSKFKADLLAARCLQLKKSCKIHLEVDTGMRRTGVRPSTAIELYHYLKTIKAFKFVGIYSHIASSENAQDKIAAHQIEQFSELIHILQDKSVLYHINSSSSSIFFSEANLGMARPSLLIFGYPPKGAKAPFDQIKPCFSLKSKVSYFKVVEKGEGVSYGHSHVTSKRTRIVTIPIGYGDGYRRCLSNKASVLIRGKKFPIVGNICMDQFMVDIGDDEAYVGDEVVLIGHQELEEISLLEIASLCKTIPYEILCLFNRRLPRIYKEVHSIGS